MIRGFPVIFAVLLFSHAIPDEEVRTSDNTTTEKKNTEDAGVGNIRPSVDDKEEKMVKGEQLEEEIDKIGKAMHPDDGVVIYQQIKTNNVDIEKKLENFTKFKLTTTHKTGVVGQQNLEPVQSVIAEDSIKEKVIEKSPVEQEGLDTETVVVGEANENEFSELTEKKDPKTLILRNLGEEEEMEAEDGEIMEDLTTTATTVETTSSTIETTTSTTETPTLDTLILTDSKKKQFLKEEEKGSSITTDALTHEEKPDDVESLEDSKKNEDSKVSWDLIHFLLLLSPYAENEVTWWAIVLEAVKCSLRNCPNNKSYWHLHPVNLPRISRHRRQDSEFEMKKVTSTPCPCKNLENYFEKLYESIEKSRKKSNSTNLS